MELAQIGCQVCLRRIWQLTPKFHGSRITVRLPAKRTTLRRSRRLAAPRVSNAIQTASLLYPSLGWLVMAQIAAMLVRSTCSGDDIVLLSLENQYMESFERLLKHLRKQAVRASVTTDIWLAISYTTSTFINALAYWWDSQLIMKGAYTKRLLNHPCCYNVLLSLC
jgi:hypothetical protein